MLDTLTPPAELVRQIRAGEVLPSAAIGRPDAYDALTTGETGKRLPFLGTSTKIEAGESVGVLSKVLYMMPAETSGKQACAYSSAFCRELCLVSSGRLPHPGVAASRARKHAAFFADRNRMLADISREITVHARAAELAGKLCAVRMNGVTDLPFHRMPFTDHDGIRWASLHAAHPNVNFYEYTKLPRRLAGKGKPDNLHFTYSVSERPDSETHARDYLANGDSVAVVFAMRKHGHPSRYSLGGIERPVIDGDLSDARFLDPAGSIVALSAKGKARGVTNGFVRPLPSAGA